MFLRGSYMWMHVGLGTTQLLLQTLNYGELIIYLLLGLTGSIMSAVLL
jgi:hypothetical protein